MLCQKCGKNNANVKIVKNYNGNVEEFYLCSSCANKEDFNLSQSINTGNLFDNFFNIFTPLEVKELVCDKCKTTYSNFKKNGKFGCDKCFSSFAGSLDPIFKNIHGATSHTGKLPKRCAEPIRRKKELENLKSDLKDAVTKENFEEAAQLRDKIRELEKEVRSDE